MISVIVPTYNEALTILPALKDIALALAGREYEVIVVDDDSPDLTWQVAEAAKREYPSLRVIRRLCSRGLSTAVLQGFAASSGDILVVMDADGQHDAALLPALASLIETGASDISIASRYMEGGSVGEWDSYRQALSRCATRIVIRLCGVKVTDPMSGFFAIRRSSYVAALPYLHPKGFKILLDFLLHLPKGFKAAEVPLHFGYRRAGESKLNYTVQWQFVQYLYEEMLERYLLPMRLFLALCIFIGALLIVRLVPIVPLYTSSETRSAATQALHSLSQRNGWLLSDLSIQSIAGNHILVRYAPHIRGADPAACVAVSLITFDAEPCDDVTS